MRFFGYLTLTLAAAVALGDGPARAATCQAENVTCPTTMPAGGYCECTSRGATHSGTVVERATSHKRQDATTGGCGAHPDAPGCR
jgi:hypothetical protein